jgi:hypothetical protein
MSGRLVAGLYLAACIPVGIAAAASAHQRSVGGPEQVAVKNGDITLGAFLWRSAGRGPFPAVLVNHGGGRSPEEPAKHHGCRAFVRRFVDGLDGGEGASLARLGKPHRLRIYPPVGSTPEEGHDFPNNSVAVWEPDVFAFLDAYVKR